MCPFTSDRAREIIAAANAKAKYGPWSDQLRHVMTREEHEYVLEVWKPMPGSTCYLHALYRILNNEAHLPESPRDHYAV